MGWTSVLSHLPYGDKFRKHRRLVQEYFHPRLIQNYYPMIELEAAMFIAELAKTPKDFRAHLRRYVWGACGCSTVMTLNQSYSRGCHENYLWSYCHFVG
jgi:cytochrome P450